MGIQLGDEELDPDGELSGYMAVEGGVGDSSFVSANENSASGGRGSSTTAAAQLRKSHALGATSSTASNKSGITVLENCVMAPNPQRLPIVSTHIDESDAKADKVTHEDRMETLCAVVAEALQRYHFLKRTVEEGENEVKDNLA